MPHPIIRTIRLAHCKLGPERCEPCRTMSEERICLLDVDPPGRGLQQRRVIEVEVHGERVWREYDVLRSFADEREAREYAAEHGIRDVVLDRPETGS